MIYDICFIIFRAKVVLNERVQPIPFINNLNTQKAKIGANATLIGWGSVDIDTNVSKLSAILLEIQSKIEAIDDHFFVVNVNSSGVRPGL